MNSSAFAETTSESFSNSRVLIFDALKIDSKGSPFVPRLHPPDGLDKDEEQMVAVYDFGGGAFNVSIVEYGDSVVEVKSTNGDPHLGGDDIDHAIVTHTHSTRYTLTHSHAVPSSQPI